MNAYVFLRCLMPAPVRRFLRGFVLALAGPSWYPAPSIARQSIAFTYRGRNLTLEADHTIPLYETIAELVDYDSYQLGALQPPSPGPVLVLDIGANIGAASVLFATIPQAKVLAYEPLPANGQSLIANLARNGITQVTWRPAAITRNDGQADFMISPIDNVGGRLAGSDKAEGHRITVQTLAWASVLREAGEGEIYLAKIDCEGGEYDIVDQFDESTSRRIRYLTFEVHDRNREHNLATIRAKLEKWGYRTRYKADVFKRPSLHHLLAESTLLIPE